MGVLATVALRIVGALENDRHVRVDASEADGRVAGRQS